MRIQEMLQKAAAFAGYINAKSLSPEPHGDDEIFQVQPPGGFWKEWNPLDVPADNEELITKLQADNKLYMSTGNRGRIDVYGAHHDADGAVAVQLNIVELYKNYNENMHQAKRMAITKLAATLYDLRGVS